MRGVLRPGVRPGAPRPTQLHLVPAATSGTLACGALFRRALGYACTCWRQDDSSELTLAAVSKLRRSLPRWARRANDWLTKRIGYRVSRIPPTPRDFDSVTKGIAASVAPYTMTSEEKISALVEAVKYVSHHGIQGAIVECGVWRGGSMMAVAKTLQHLGETRDLYLFDTFAGMTEPTAHDVDSLGRSAARLLSEADESLTRSGDTPASTRCRKTSGQPAMTMVVCTSSRGTY